MAFSKKARAGVIHPDFGTTNWQNFVRQHGAKLYTPHRTAAGGPNLVGQASEILDEEFDPKNYLLTHATIVASVDVHDVPNVKLGTINEMGRQIKRKWADYRITEQSDKFINNNYDAWSRPVLLKSYRTFVGAHNFVEHVQIEEQSKGRIIDAVARDIGDSVYVDILVATHRKHGALVDQIKSGRMSTMSMGCFLEGTQVTMGDGTRVAIEEVAPGDMVMTHKGHMRPVTNKQIRSYKGEMRYIRAVGVSSPIRATANHGFHVLRPSKICACGCGETLSPSGSTTRRMNRRFKPGHDKRIYNPNNTYSLDEARDRKEKIASLKEFSFEKVRADELEVGDFVAFPRLASSAVEGWTVGKARLVGYFLAEGSFLKHKGDPTETQFNFSMGEKDTYVQEVVDLLSQEFPGSEPWVQERPERDTCVVHVCGREIAEWFRGHCGEYSHGKRMSQEAMALPAELHKHVVGAWINGDGTFGQANKTLSATTVSYDLACQMHMLLARCGIFARMECRQDAKTIEIAQAVGSDWSPNFETGKRPALNLVMGLTGQETLRGFSDKVGQETSAKQQMRVLEDYVIFPITSIEKGWHEGLVYNMEVEEDHTYVVEGVAVYNCTVTETICTKCGNVATDETDMCEHIKYAKGSQEFDELGRRYRVAELCGHESLDPTGGVHFIEASWVATPAFPGAVLRSVVEPATPAANIRTKRQIRNVMATPSKEWSEDDNMRAASLGGGLPVTFQTPSIWDRYDVAKLAFEFDMDESGGEEEESADKSEDKDELAKVEDELVEYVSNRVKNRMKEKLRQKQQEDAAYSGEMATSKNENINKQAMEEYRNAISGLVVTSRNDADLMDRVASYEKKKNFKVSTDLYRTALRVGSTAKYGSVSRYLVHCGKVLGRQPTTGEAKTLVRLGRILSMRK